MDNLIDTFANRLTHALNIRNMKPIELAVITNIDKSKISSYMSGRYKAKTDGLKKIADALDVSPVWLMGYDVPMNSDTEPKITFVPSSKPFYTEYDGKKVFPLLGKVKAGYNYLATENIIGFVNINKRVPDTENYFALKIVGDSMQPVLYEDDIIIVHKQNDVENGQIAIVLIDDDEAAVKKIIKYDNYIELISFNSYYPPKKLTQNDNFHIIGKVIEARISKIFE